MRRINTNNRYRIRRATSAVWPIMLFCSYSFGTQPSRILLGNDTIVNNFFNPTEVGELAKMLAFTDSVLLGGKVTDQRIANDYLSVINKHLEEVKHLGYCCRSFMPVQPVTDIFLSLSPSLFYKIWRFHTLTSHSAGGTKHRDELSINVDNSVYFAYIKTLVLNNIKLRKYQDDVFFAGEINLTITFSDYQFINWLNDRERLLIAIEFLTYNIPEDAYSRIKERF